MHRRHLLQVAGNVAGLAWLGSACSGEDGPPASTDEEELFVQAASLEFLVGRNRWVAFGVRRAADNTPVEEADLQVWLRTVPSSSASEPEVLAGPLQAMFSAAEDTGQGIYYLQYDFDDPGFYEIVVTEGSRNGSAAIQVVDPADSQVPVPGSQAVSAPTATEEDDLGVFAVCTLNPPCGMHEISLDAALEAGQPIALIFATPQFCQTAVCGPSVATLEGVRTSRDWGETIFIHSEIYQDEPSGDPAASAAPLVPAVEAWGLPSEPWLFTIAADGIVQGRLDGPMPQPIITAMLQDLQGA